LTATDWQNYLVNYLNRKRFMTVAQGENLKKFELTEPQETYRCPIFRVESREAKSPDGLHKQAMFTIRCAPWVNVVPVTADGHIVLTLSALRELEEETGLTSQRLLALPGFAPNPAIQGNRITYFIAFDCQPLAVAREHCDPFEQIKIHFVPIEEALMMARTGQIQHALAALALLIAEPYLRARVKKS
jgi:ADP-ribose pyrophosphatase